MDVSSFLGGNFLTQVDLPQPCQMWTIAKADQQLVGQGQSAEQKICIRFREFPSKPLALNKTNLTRVADLYSTDAGAWIGKPLLVYRSSTSYQGQPKLCVRVCGPQQAPPDPLCDPQGNAVLYQPPAPPVQQQPVPAPANQPAQPQPAPAQPQPAASQPVQAPAPWEQHDGSPPSA